MDYLHSITSLFRRAISFSIHCFLNNSLARRIPKIESEDEAGATRCRFQLLHNLHLHLS